MTVFTKKLKSVHICTDCHKLTDPFSVEEVVKGLN